MSIRIIEPTPESKLLRQVIELADENTNTLGFLPEEAFLGHAARKLIICAIDDDANLLGYLLYRYVRKEHKATIVHLCVNEKYRMSGIARLLFNELKAKTKAYYGIGLLCRRDYKQAISVWKSLGFQPKNQKRGRGKQDTTLMFYWYDHGHPTLFDIAANDKIQVVIDANIFFDFQDTKKAEAESLALNADWLREEIELKVTKELFQEIDRQDNDTLRKKHLKQANEYLLAQDSESNWNIICEELRKIFPPQKKDNDESDLKQIAWAIADRDVDFFVTRDGGILDLFDKIYTEYGLSILRPTDLILQIHEYVRIDEYTHMRFAGTQLTYRRVQSKELQKLVGAFLYDDQRENEASFKSIISPYLVDVNKYSTYVVEDSNENLLVLVVFERTRNDELTIPIFRINRKFPDKKIIRYLILKFLAQSAEEKRDFTRITEPKLQDIVLQALQEDTFIPESKNWIKINLPLVDTTLRIAKYLEEKLSDRGEIETYYRMQISNLRNPSNVNTLEVMSEIERLFWPLKIIDSNITTISISINADWANRWFDEKLATQTLFGAERERAFNREGIYYSGRSLKSINLPARIVWYVKKDDRASGTEAIRACSRLEDIVIGSARDIYRQFRHLGIYEWKNIENMTGGNPDKIITAYRFTDTQLFVNPVPYEKWEGLTLRSTGKKPNRQSPASMPNEVFIQIYKIGMGLD